MKAQAYTVTEVTRYIKNILDDSERLNFIFIKGEISNFKIYPSGHCYFILKDAISSLKAVMFKSSAIRLRFKPENGLKVVVAGKISVYERDGVYQLYATSMIPDGVGELMIAFEQLKSKLSEEGLFEQRHKNPIPFLPAAVGVVTSPAGAAVQDIIKVARRRHPYIKIVIYPVQVQGQLAGEQIAHAIKTFNNIKTVDVLIVGRGGGSLEDLWAFNEEVVARAIFASEIPVISAVGHETDTTLADFVSDVRAATPSQAAEIAVPDYWQLQQHLDTIQQRMLFKIKRIIGQKKEDFQKKCSQNNIDKLNHVYETKKTNLIENIKHFESNLCAVLHQKKINLKTLTEKLAILNPLATLARGYCIIYNENMNSLQRPETVQKDDMINIRFNKGNMVAKVREVKITNGEKEN